MAIGFVLALCWVFSHPAITQRLPFEVRRRSARIPKPITKQVKGKNMETPTFHSYGHYTSDNYGVNALCFTDAQGRDYYYSYKTLVAFLDREGLIVRKNVWGSTTGKHLNWIDTGGKGQREARMSETDFAAELERRLLHNG